MGEPSIPESLPPLQPRTPEAQRLYEEVFLPRYERILKEIDQTCLHILVWGPGRGGGKLYEKRVKICNKLRELGHDALFSEDLPSLPEKSQKVVELAQAQAADFIIVIEASHGSVGEVHDFAAYDDIIPKMLIFIDVQVTGGYNYRILGPYKTLYNNVETFRYPEDIDECHLLTKILERVKALQQTKWLAEQKRLGWG